MNEALAAAGPAVAVPDAARLEGALEDTEHSARRLALHDAHLAAGAEMVDSHGWTRPSSYGAAHEEHGAVRRRAGMFDLSWLSMIDVRGPASEDWLRTLLTIDASRLAIGQSRYGCLCNDHGGVIDNPVVHRLGEYHWRLTGDPRAREHVRDWLEIHRPSEVELSAPENVVLLSVQGPEAVTLADEALRATWDDAPEISVLARYTGATVGPVSVARIGCSGEDGVEIGVPADDAPALWAALLVAGVRPCGLRARDTLRLEAGYSAYGRDLDDAHTPIESGIDHVVDLADRDRAFFGRDVMAEQKAIATYPGRVGIVLETTGALERGQRVQLAGRDIGVITSAAASPTRGESIAIARVSRAIKRHCDVMVNERPMAAHTVTLPFVRAGDVFESD